MRRPIETLCLRQEEKERPMVHQLVTCTPACEGINSHPTTEDEFAAEATARGWVKVSAPRTAGPVMSMIFSHVDSGHDLGKAAENILQQAVSPCEDPYRRRLMVALGVRRAINWLMNDLAMTNNCGD